MALYKQYPLTEFTSGFAPNKFEKQIRESDITIEYSHLYNDGLNVQFHFEEELDSTNIGYLDALVVAHDGIEIEKPTRITILNNILSNVSSQEQLSRLMDALDTSATLLAALDNFNYTLARSRVDKLLADEKITEDDRTLIFQYIPEI